jgi:hypothetical protein
MEKLACQWAKLAKYFSPGPGKADSDSIQSIAEGK